MTPAEHTKMWRKIWNILRGRYWRDRHFTAITGGTASLVNMNLIACTADEQSAKEQEGRD